VDRPLPEAGDAKAAFRAFYTDLVRVNGAALTSAKLVAYAAFAEAERSG
jgi:hypothetical protein